MSDPPIHIEGSVGGDVFSGDKRVIDTGGGNYYENVTNAAPIGIAALHQLPSPAAGFTGRAAELAELRHAVHDQGAAICGLRGLGGVGKTALALVLAHELTAGYPDAQIFLNLQGVTQPLAPEAVMAHVIRAFQPVARLPDDPDQLAAIYRSVLTGRRVLLLLDNAANARQVKPLIPPPGCLLLVTSRQKLALPGLKAVNLNSLPPSEAAALLLKLADRIGDHAARLAELCGCLPLALTLVGSAFAERDDLEPDAYARRLAQTRLTVLDEVEASLALSYDLIVPELQRWWRALCVFPADFDAPAAAAVWALEPDPAADRLGDLLRFSLLDFNTDTRRYRMHDLARDFARARLDETEHAAAQRRLAEHYKNVLAAAHDAYLLGGENSLRGLAVFDQERANILAGQAWAAGQAPVDDDAARLTSEYAGKSFYIRDLRQLPPEKIAWLEAALAAARRLGDRAGESIHLGHLGLAYDDLGDARRAIAYQELALAIDRETGNRQAEGQDLGNLGIVYRRLGETRQAIYYTQQQLQIARELGDRTGEGNATGILGNAYLDLGQVRQAAEYFDLALQIARETGDRRREANALGNLAITTRQLGEPRRAIEYFEQILVLHREMGDRRGQAFDLGNLGVVHALLDEVRPAVDYYEQSLKVLRDLGDRLGEAQASWNLGLTYLQQGDLPKAVKLMQVSVDIQREMGHANAEADAAQVEALRRQLAGG